MRQSLRTTKRAIRATALAVAAVGVFAIQANGQSTLAYWNFDTLSGSPASINADTGNGTLYLTPDHTGTPGTGGKTTTGTATGSTLNTPLLNQSGLTALTLPNGITGNVLV